MSAPEHDTTLEALRQENQSLKRAIEELALLNELAREIGASLNSQDIIETIIRRSLRAVNAEQGTITLVDEQALTPMKTLVRTQASSSRQQAFHLEQSLQGWMLLNKKPLIINDPRHDERFRSVPWDESIRSLVCVPLLVKSELKGILTIYNKKGGDGFSAEDQRLLGIIAAQSAQVVESARLYEEEQAFQLMQNELKFAAKIQLTLLPKTMPQIAAYDIAGKSLPAQRVGGDYFDFIAVDENRLALCLGDVSGKGMPAALLMSNLQAIIRGQTLTEASAPTCLHRANKLLWQNNDACNFITLFYGLLDFHQHQLACANAGHNPPFLFTADQTHRQLQCRGLALGIRNNMTYTEETIALHRGDFLVIYSDGITEAMNDRQEEFGEERLVQTVNDNYALASHELLARIIDAVKQHAGKTPQSDDITLMIIRRK